MITPEQMMEEWRAVNRTLKERREQEIRRRMRREALIFYAALTLLGGFIAWAFVMMHRRDALEELYRESCTKDSGELVRVDDTLTSTRWICISTHSLLWKKELHR